MCCCFHTSLVIHQLYSHTRYQQLWQSLQTNNTQNNDLFWRTGQPSRLSTTCKAKCKQNTTPINIATHSVFVWHKKTVLIHVARMARVKLFSFLFNILISVSESVSCSSISWSVSKIYIHIHKTQSGSLVPNRCGK